MDVTQIYTTEQAKKMLQLWMDAEEALVNGQATSYKVGTREVTLLNMKEIRAAIKYWGNVIQALSGKVRTKRGATTVFRDL